MDNFYFSTFDITTNTENELFLKVALIYIIYFDFAKHPFENNLLTRHFE